MGKIRRIGIIGGTFNPIHYGHLVTAESARTKFDLDQIIFVPAKRPPHKKNQEICAADQRANMVSMAIASNPFFSMSDIELKRDGYSYSYETISSFAYDFGPATSLFFITGADAVLGIATWKNPEQLLNLCTFIAATRPGYNLEGLKKLPPLWREKIKLMEIPSLAISSTDFRKSVANNESIKYLLPETVENYIIKEKIYCNQAEI